MQAKVNLTHDQLQRLIHGGVLTIRLRDTELLLSAVPESPTDLFEKFVKLMLDFGKGKR